MNKMSDPNSAMMQIVMQMIQSQKTSGNIIKAQSNLQFQQFQASQFQAQQFVPKQPVQSFEKINLVTPTFEQRQKAKLLTQQFILQKNQTFTPEQIQNIENKILERIMQDTKRIM